MKPWTIKFRGFEWSDETATTAHLVAVAELIGDGWDSVSPWNGPRVLAAWVAVLVASDAGDLDAAVNLVYAVPVVELLGCLDERVVPPVVAVAA